MAPACTENDMTRIDFHSNVPDKVVYACRLVRKARAANCRIVLLTGDANQAANLDATLWAFSELDFLPHVLADDPLAEVTPVIVADSDTTALPHHDVLINLSGKLPSHFARFERLFEIISGEDDDKLAGRERYRFYQQRGYPLTHFVAERS
jgi:DNA polymerase-3 subunit chi